MNKREIIVLLNTKAETLGFSRRELSDVADSIMAAERAERDYRIKQKIDEYLLKYIANDSQTDGELSHVDWEQRRFEIAKSVLPSLLRIHCVIPNWKQIAVNDAVELADALINKLRTPEDTQEKLPDSHHEVAIGEIVEYQGEHLLCVEKKDNEDCSGCAFRKGDDCNFKGHCYSECREDGKNVIFVGGKA